MARGGQRKGAGRQTLLPRKKRQFYIPVEKYDEIVKAIKALISSYNCG